MKLFFTFNTKYLKKGKTLFLILYSVAKLCKREGFKRFEVDKAKRPLNSANRSPKNDTSDNPPYIDMYYLCTLLSITLRVAEITGSITDVDFATLDLKEVGLNPCRNSI